jgi:hypothetical protein
MRSKGCAAMRLTNNSQIQEKEEFSIKQKNESKRMKKIKAAQSLLLLIVIPLPFTEERDGSGKGKRKRTLVVNLWNALQRQTPFHRNVMKLAFVLLPRKLSNLVLVLVILQNVAIFLFLFLFHKRIVIQKIGVTELSVLFQRTQPKQSLVLKNMLILLSVLLKISKKVTLSLPSLLPYNLLNKNVTILRNLVIKIRVFSKIKHHK